MAEEITARQSILAVDDDRQIRELLAMVIGLLGHDSITAVDGMDALEKLAKSQFDIIITDIDMPRLDGIELIKRVASEHQDVDVVAITGYQNKYKYTDIIELGASDFISKPFSLDKLTARVNRIVRERSLRQQFKSLSILDGLTGLYNRRHFDENLKREAQRALRQHYGLFLLLVDIDKFKEYNDKFGHQQGDNLLKELGKTILLSIRENVDSGFRYGGDEFAVILPHTNRQQAVMVAERLLCNYNELKLVPTSLSIGVAELKGVPQTLKEDLQALFREADQALYLAKNAGGNQVCIEGEVVGLAGSLLDSPIIRPC